MDISKHLESAADAGTKLGFIRGVLAAASLFSMFTDEYQRITALAFANTDELALRPYDEETRDIARALIGQKTPEAA